MGIVRLIESYAHQAGMSRSSESKGDGTKSDLSSNEWNRKRLMCSIAFTEMSLEGALSVRIGHN